MAEEPPSTVAIHGRNALRNAYDMVKGLGNILLGCLCFVLLSVMGLCSTNAVDKDKDIENIPPRGDANDLESQASLNDGLRTDIAEGRETDERYSHDNGDGCRSIMEGSTSEDAVRPRSEPMPPGDVTVNNDHVVAVNSAKPPTVVPEPERHSPSSGEKVGSVELRQTPPTVAVESPILLRTSSQGGADDSPRPGSIQDASKHINDNVTESEQNQHGEVNNVTDERSVEVIRKPPSRSFTFENEAARRFFTSGTDSYSEKEIAIWSRSLNSRINSFSAHLIREKNRKRGFTKVGNSNRGSSVQGLKVAHEAEGMNQISELVRKALGNRLYAETIKSGRNGKASSAHDASIQDALDAWSVFCMHKAMGPILFGLRLRTAVEIEEIIRHMVDYEPELAQGWNRLRVVDPPRNIDPRILAFVRDICPSSRQPDTKDIEEYTILEEIYRRDFVNEQGRQIALHWRALLHKHELGLDSYKEAIKQTEEILRQGLLQVFVMAGIEPPTLSHSFRDMIQKIVKDAATLAEYTKTGVFSQSVEAVMYEPGCSFDRDSMKPADEGDAGEVLCTIQLGLNAIDSEGQLKILSMPEVLLA